MKHETVDLWEIPHQYTGQGYKAVCGVDEAGRGPLAGPVYAAAVILPDDYEIPGLNDSKQLTDKKRRELYPVIQEEAVAFGIASVPSETVDEINILQATFLAMQEAVRELPIAPDLILVDGNRLPDLPVKAEAIVHGDARVAQIAAASILAKVARDDFMLQADAQWPEYGFAVHKGYGTKRHFAAIREYGPCPLHRRTFLKKFYEQGT